MPNANASDLPNTQLRPTPFIKAAFSAPDISPDSATHYDDIVRYLTIEELLRLAYQYARDWTDSMFNASSTANMTSASLNPAAPHFISSGTTLTGQSFSTTDATGTSVQAGTGVGAFSACLWWPNSLTLVNGSLRRKMLAYVEFASTDNSNDALPGFTMGFLPASDAAGPPINSTCGTGIAATTSATGAASQTDLTVASTAGIMSGYRVFGSGIPYNATVTNIDPVTDPVILSVSTTSAVSGLVSFANGNQVRRDLGWAGGSLASFADRFAVEFDAVQDTAVGGPPAVATANDPSRPHLAIDFGGTIHTSTSESCATTRRGLPCDSPGATAFPIETIDAVGVSGATTLTVSSVDGIVHGMTVTAASGFIPASTTVTAMAENAGSSVGRLKNADMGVFQIVAQNSAEEYSWGGSFNTTSKRKTATITVKLEYETE